jgi:hypothetical protein
MHTLFFVEKLQDLTDSEGNPYQAYVVGPKEFLPNKVLKVGSQGAFDIILITTPNDKWHTAAQAVNSYIGDNYLEIIMDSFIGHTDAEHPYIGNPNIVRACIDVVYDEDVAGEIVRKRTKLGDWIDAGRPGTKVSYRKPVKILGLDID